MGSIRVLGCRVYCAFSVLSFIGLHRDLGFSLELFCLFAA